MQLYVLIFLAVCISWLRWPKELAKAAFWVLVLAFLIHTFGLLSRMYIQGRPPVTNLYSSAVFVGWGAVLLGIFIEKFFKNGIGAAMASLVGFCTLIIAHHLAMTGDTLEMMRAVLDSNFWLATHVVIITFGYSAIFWRAHWQYSSSCSGSSVVALIKTPHAHSARWSTVSFALGRCLA
jgi:ABC-type transport system involved in cytochrome c biogenesis permease subunit